MAQTERKIAQRTGLAGEDVLKGVRKTFPAVKGERRMNGERFCQRYPHGRYILQMAGHWTCCIDGVIYDTWDCTEKCVYAAWEIPEQQKNPNDPKLTRI